MNIPNLFGTHTTKDILLATQVFCDADHRNCLTEILRPITVYDPTIEQAIAAYQSTCVDPAVPKLIDPVDLYMWEALAESERQMIALIEARRAPGNMGHTAGAPWRGKTCACGLPAEWPSATPNKFLCQEH